jgi:ankyrin repeat protein
MTPIINSFSTIGNSNNIAYNHINRFNFTTKSSSMNINNSMNISNAKKRQYNHESRSDTTSDEQQLKQQQDVVISLTDFVRIAFRENNGLIKHDVDLEQSIVERCQKRITAPTQDMLESYGIPGLVNAIRENDLVQAKQLYEDKILTCNACNRFGESILHMACRRGHLEMVDFLINTVGLSIINIKDDYHRTPLHDAFWSSSVQKYDIVDMLLSHSPEVVELLFCKDKRGFTPLDYARKQDYSKWYQLLQDRKSSLRSSSISSTTITREEVRDLVDIPTEQQQQQQQTLISNKRQRSQYEIE